MNEIEQVVCRYALGGKSEALRQDAAVLIRVGVAALNIRETNLKTNTVVATLDEPLVVEAGIRYYDVERGTAQTDWLYTIHGGNATDFFTGEVLELLNHRKGRSLDSHENASVKKQKKVGIGKSVSRG